MTSNSLTALRVVVALLGVFAIFSGLNTGLGGLTSMGWMGQDPYFAVTNATKYAQMDSHYRFFGGVWAGVGIFMLVAITDVRKYQMLLSGLFGIVFVGGLARLSQLSLDVLLTPGVAWAISVELVGMPLLLFWLWKSAQQSD